MLTFNEVCVNISNVALGGKASGKIRKDNVEKKKYLLTTNDENGIITECHKSTTIKWLLLKK